MHLQFNDKRLNLSIWKPPTPNPSQIAAKFKFDFPHLVTEAEEHAKRITASLKASKTAGIHEDVDPYYDEEDYDEQYADQQ